MKTYHYPRYFHEEHRKYAGLFFSLFMLLVILITAVADNDWLKKDFAMGILIILAAFAAVGYDLYKINMYPDITVSEKGLRVEFLWFYIPISWENVESVHTIQSNYHPQKYTEWFVRTKKLTPLHVFYGKSKYGDYVPGFIIRSEMENVQQIVNEIENKLQSKKR